MNPILFAITTSITAILFALWLTLKIYKYPSGDDKMAVIAKAIQIGARTYFNRQYKAVAVAAITASARISSFI